MNRVTQAAVAAGAAVVVAGTALATPALAADTAASSLVSAPQQGTGGLIIRDAQGNDLGSGIGEDQDFKFVGCGPEGSGLIKVDQLRRGGGGGWGELYSGYVKQEYTQAPGMFPCED